MIEGYNILEYLERHGFAVSAGPECVAISPASRLPDEIRVGVRAHAKAIREVLGVRDLLSFLRCGPEHPDHRVALKLAVLDPEHLATLRASAGAEMQR